MTTIVGRPLADRSVGGQAIGHGGWQAVGVRIQGYDNDGPLAAGETLLTRPGFWTDYLLGLCGTGAGQDRPVPQWFGDDGADADALSETIMDPQWWPVLRVPTEDGPGFVVVYRNLTGDAGVDFLLTRPGRDAQQIGGWEDGLSGTGLSWPELLDIADNPAPAAEGVGLPAARLLLMLPLLQETEIPGDAPGRVRAALEAVGAPKDTAGETARRILVWLTNGWWQVRG